MKPRWEFYLGRAGFLLRTPAFTARLDIGRWSNKYGESGRAFAAAFAFGPWEWSRIV
jgi:hypothetical protein